jgi:hypothetical protein
MPHAVSLLQALLHRSVRAWFEFVLVWLVVWLSYACVCLLLFAGRWGVRSACVGAVEFVGDTQACIWMK